MLGNASVKMCNKWSVNQQESEIGHVDSRGRRGEEQGSRQMGSKGRFLPRPREHKSSEDQGMSSHCALIYRREKDLR